MTCFRDIRIGLACQGSFTPRDKETAGDRVRPGVIHGRGWRRSLGMFVTLSVASVSLAGASRLRNGVGVGVASQILGHCDQSMLLRRFFSNIASCLPLNIDQQSEAITAPSRAVDLHLDELGSGLSGDEARAWWDTDVLPIDGLTIEELASLG